MNFISKYFIDIKKRNLIIQIIFLICIFLLFFMIISNTHESLERQKIASGFSFLSQESGFEISESLFKVSSADSYGKVLIAGLLNTLKIALIGNFLAFMIGLFFGVSRLSKNWLVSKISLLYIEFIRNIPLLLQLFFWYSIFTDIFPSVKRANEILPNVFLSNRGLYFPWFNQISYFYLMIISFIIGTFISFLIYHSRLKKQKRVTGQWLLVYLLLPLMFVIICGFYSFFNDAIEYPVLKGFNFRGGLALTPEYLSLMLGLVLYTGAFNAEIIRSGILSIKKGQWEAATSLGLNRFETLRYVILPQAMKLVIPPMTSQFLNLTKNSSLAVAIAYPDFVAVANTSMNQTGQAVELVALIMGLYLTLSLLTSLVMNFINKKMELKQRS